MRKKILYIQPEENIAYVIDKISSAPEQVLYLAVDANPSIITDAINLKLFKKEVGELLKHIIIVSKTTEILEMAKKSGFETTSEDISHREEDIEETEEMEEVEEMENDEIPISVKTDSAVKSTAPSVNATREFGISDAIEDDDDSGLPAWMHKKSTEEVENNLETQMVSRSQTNRKPDNITKGIAHKLLSWKLIVISVLAVTALAVGAFYFLSPKVTIDIIITKAPLNLDFKVTSDATISTIDFKNDKIPGQSIKLEKELSDQFIATGVQDKESKAEGKITIYNEFGLSPQRLVKNTRFKSNNGSIFRLKGDISVPGATIKDGKVVSPGIIVTEVIADQVGPNYNIEPSDFTIPGFEGTPKFIAFYGKSSDAMSGGSLGDGKFATKENLAGAQTALIEKFKKSEGDLINNNLAKGLKTLPRAKEDPVFEFSTEPVGQDGKFIGKLKVSEKIFAFSENDINSLVTQYLSDKLSDAQTVDAESKNISYTEESLGANHLSLNFTVKINQSVKGMIDEAEIKRNIAGKNEEGMKEVLKSNEAIESAEFAFWPIWVSVAPKNPENIIISIKE